MSHDGVVPSSQLPVPRTPAQALRLVAAVLTVGTALLLGSLGGVDPPEPTYHHYVALGDSFTAAPFVPLNDVARGCNRSTGNYPRQLADQLRIEDLQDRSCTGAQTADLLRRQVTVTGERVPPQLAAVDARTDLVTMGLGANNYRLYARLATQCRKLRTICPLADEQAQLFWIVDQVRPALVGAVAEVRERAPRARVVLVGYPRFLPVTGTCAKFPRMRAEDRQTFRAVNLRLRDEMAAAAREARVEFVDYYTASFGHDVCAPQPWIQGRQGDGHVGAALHPLPDGQAAVARLLSDVLREPPPDRVLAAMRDDET